MRYRRIPEISWGATLRQAFPTSLWLSGVTQFEIPAGKLCLSPILDCFDSAIVSWRPLKVSERRDSQLHAQSSAYHHQARARASGDPLGL
ncbi:hypothetical protein [Atopobium sp. oral taxon 416]|uniref:hypothetical protein n=1 Tax=Atopobium sp. oral taxon 416 TaxID=712157 RepID=UPI001BA6DB9E|nr:hypothetical protein [Atopobium sp. oral taxon 416]QUC02076.1 hypothetical protein J4859_08365 [Atopobium sp. oral taxon 416]QUC02794.1 hypothetical protein J4859_12360 [Atopobium sp. oral taxon 416]